MAQRTSWSAGQVLAQAEESIGTVVSEARAAFMARVQSMPTSAWPWSAVQATAPRGGGGGGLGSIVAVPKPVTPTTPAALILIRGQAESADAEDAFDFAEGERRQLGAQELDQRILRDPIHDLHPWHPRTGSPGCRVEE